MTTTNHTTPHDSNGYELLCNDIHELLVRLDHRARCFGLEFGLPLGSHATEHALLQEVLAHLRASTRANRLVSMEDIEQQSVGRQ